MTPLLEHLRQNARHITARQFLAAHPGSFIQYYDDTPAKDPAKALSARSFDPGLARCKQRQQCAVGFSLHGFCERLLEKGTDHLTVAELMGHADGKMVATVYSHLGTADRHLHEALKKASEDDAA